jgi:hypothetical protein
MINKSGWHHLRNASLPIEVSNDYLPNTPANGMRLAWQFTSLTGRSTPCHTCDDHTMYVWKWL